MDMRPRTLSALLKDQRYKAATAFRIIGRGDFTRKEVIA